MYHGPHGRLPIETAVEICIVYIYTKYTTGPAGRRHDGVEEFDIRITTPVLTGTSRV